MTLIEAMVAMVILAVGAGGLISGQLMAVRSTQLGRRMAEASTLATDLQESIQSWDFNDPRLTPLRTVASLDDDAVKARWDMGSGNTPAYTAQYSDAPGDPNATTSDALGAAYLGLRGYDSEDGKRKLVRYWNVYEVNFESAGFSDGKLVQIIVRWQEAGSGFKQTTSSAFKRNPAKASVL